MAALIVPDVVCNAGRTEEFEWQAYKADGKTPEAFAAGDVVRFKLSASSGGTPILDLASNATTANGSRVIVDEVGEAGVTPASGRVRLAQGDTSGFSGKRAFELDLVDNSEDNPADAIKTICRGSIVFWPTQGGSIGT